MAATSRRSRSFEPGRPARALALAAMLALPACSGMTWIPPGLGLNRLMPIPQPFKADVKTMAPALSTNEANDISLTEIAGLSREDREALAAALTRACDRYDILLQPHLTARRTSLLEGSATVTPVARGRDITIAFNWRQPDGVLVTRFEVRGVDPRPVGPLDPETLPVLATDIAGQLAAARGIASVKARTAQNRPRIFIGRVTGALGDGNKALAGAMAAVLAAEGVDITSDRKRATHVLTATVAVADTSDPGTQAVSIIWQLGDPAGRILAEIGQSNAVPKGALDQAWGDTAYDVAHAASDGLITAFDQMAAPAPSPPRR